MNRLIEKMVFSGLVTACRFATWPTSRSPVLVNATTDGVNRPPSGLVMTTGSPPSITATTELVVPRSIPMILLMRSLLNLSAGWSRFPGSRGSRGSVVLEVRQVLSVFGVRQSNQQNPENLSNLEHLANLANPANPGGLGTPHRRLYFNRSATAS